MTLFGPKSLYDALLVDQNATLDEIKLAFKKRALQVHPDKGGSKEAFHLVYQALETLADPEARKKYDHSLYIRESGNMPRQRPGDVLGKKTATWKHCHPTAKEAQSKRRAPNPKGKSRRPRGNTGSEPSPQAPQSKQTKLLIKIRDLLKQLPRDVRNDAISNDFSQKQRLILEKWMVDSSSQAHSATEAAPLTLAGQESSASSVQETTEDRIYRRDVANGGGCNVVAVLVYGKVGRVCAATEMPAAKRPAMAKLRDKKNDAKKRVRSGCGSLHKCYAAKCPSYAARICFDNVELFTRYSDLQTALEHLVILTSVKQKVQDGTGLPANFEERLQTALMSSAQEHGKQIEDLKVRFAVHQRAGIFIGHHSMLKSPCVRNVEALRKLRDLLDPFRAYAKKHLQGAKIFWQYSPAHVEHAWERFQQAVADAWKVAGADSTLVMKTVRAGHAATANSRTKALQSWERQHMAKEDKNKHRPRSLRDRNTKYLECRERLRMARQDKNEHRPRGLREKSSASCLELWEREQMAMQDRSRHCPRRLRSSFQKSFADNILSRKLLALKTLLARWERVLKRQACFEDKEYRKALRLRQLQQRKDKEKQRRLEALNQKRIREEERLRREVVRKRMKSSDFMDDIPWV